MLLYITMLTNAFIIGQKYSVATALKLFLFYAVAQKVVPQIVAPPV